jgi:hypothetical protein
MAITWNGTTHLSGEEAQNGYDCVKDLQFTGAEIVQEDAIVRGTTMSRIARGNFIREATFTVHRQHADAATAIAFAQAHPETFVGVAALAWESGSWANASVIATVQAIGVLTITNYRVRGQT